ncbi:phage holin family protein [Flavobacterium psychrotrophum]|uniref:phage holin family protein n=1 Tax=Flavobacterium psychrotrophum TaxID=2294119 RepID=UPI000E30F7F1|nr:phage holin family protein [Flavobacterium psychrotrophum]
MKTLIKIFFTTIFVLVLAHFMPGVYVESFQSALLVAVVLGLLNIFIKPLLVIFTLPATIFTFGLFLLVINGIIVMICDYLLEGFRVATFWQALLFSLVLSFGQALISTLSDNRK